VDSPQKGTKSQNVILVQRRLQQRSEAHLLEMVIRRESIGQAMLLHDDA
jgi:hypothetical protein